MATPKRGHFRLRSSVKPPVTAGKYQMLSRQAGTPFSVADETTHVTVTSPRYVMPPDQILSSYPPANGEGAFGDRLPQIVLKRRTLPWERNPTGAVTVSDTPWLALVVVAEHEAQLSSPAPVADCLTQGVELLDPDDRDVEKGVYLAVTETVLKKVFPTEEDLPLLTHVREVDVQDTELAGGDDDGWLAVVLANRLPVYDTAADKPVRYLACLVNVEGQLDALPPPQAPLDFFEFALAQDWSQIDARLADPDLFTTGGGFGGSPVGGGATPSTNPAPTPRTGALRLPGIGASLDGAASTRAGSASEAWAASPTRRVAEAAVDPDAPRLVRDTMGIGFRVPIDRIALEKVYRFPVLAHWSFTTTGGETFETLMQDLDVGLLGTVTSPRRDPTDPTEPPPAPTGSTLVETGHIRLDHATRRGDATSAWYRGPFVPHPTDRSIEGLDASTVAHAADQLRRVVPDGREDLGLAAAFEIGRLLALSQLSIVSALLRFRNDQFGASRVRKLLDTIVPEAIRATLDPAMDLSHLVGTRFVGQIASRPVQVVGVSRPIADPGRPIELSQGLDAAVADGLGLDLAAVRKATEQVGVAAALAASRVPLVDPDNDIGLESASGSELREALHEELARMTSLTLPHLEDLAGGAIADVDSAVRVADALDRLIDRVGREMD